MLMNMYRSRKFQSTPSAWRETSHCVLFWNADRISIHSLRMEGDKLDAVRKRFITISIHSLRMEGDKLTVSTP